jgi:hypothetical protein
MKKRILFICNTFPGVNPSAGSILYEKILKAYGADNFFIISTDNVNINNHQNYKQSLNIDLKNSFKSRIGRALAKQMSLIMFLYIWLHWLFVRKRVIKKIKKYEPQTLLITLRGNLLLIIRDLIKKSGFRGNIVLYDSDTIEPDRSRGKFIFKQIRINYNWLIDQSTWILVAGEGMKNMYKKLNINTTEILRVPFDNELERNKSNSKPSNKITVFFAGSMYAKEAFLVFIMSLEVIAKKNGEIEFEVIIATHEKMNLPKVRFKIIQTGWLNEVELRKNMDNSDFAYIPYSFKKKSKHQMTYAFPSKIGFYVSNGLPVFFHGPSYSSVYKFIEEHKIGVNCLHNDIENVVNSLLQMIDIIHFNKGEIEKNLTSTYINEFSHDVFTKKISNVL